VKLFYLLGEEERTKIEVTDIIRALILIGNERPFVKDGMIPVLLFYLGYFIKRML